MISVNGAAISSPSKMSVGIYDVSRSADRNAEGDILIDRVAVKRKLECEWPPLSNAAMSTLLSAVTSVFFTVTYPDPQDGTDKTITCYVGDRTAPVLKYTAGVPYWEGLRMNFIER
jgi:hypothetical protein